MTHDKAEGTNEKEWDACLPLVRFSPEFRLNSSACGVKDRGEYDVKQSPQGMVNPAREDP